MQEGELWVRPPEPTGDRATGEVPVVGIGQSVPSPLAGRGSSSPVAIESTSLAPELQQRVTRIRQVQGRLLCRRSPVVALEASALAGGGAFAAGVAGGWFVLHRMPTLVTSSDQRVVLTLVGGVFALTVTVGAAGYVSARWRHARTIPLLGRVGATSSALLVALIAVGGVLITVQPWRFPSTNVVSVSTLRAGEYLALRQVAGGAVLYGTANIPLAYLRTTTGTWVEARLPQRSVAAVVQDLSVSPIVTYTRGQIARGIGGSQQDAIRQRTEWLWLMIGVMGVSTAVLGSAERRKWREAPWLAPIADDTVRAMARAQAGLD